MKWAPGHVTSLSEMLRFYARKIYFIRHHLRALRSLSKRIEARPEPWPTEDEAFTLVKLFSELGEDCEACGLEFSLVPISDMLRVFLPDGARPGAAIIRKYTRDAAARIEDELKAAVLYRIEKADERLITSPEPLGSEVTKSFSTATFDIGEASKCLAFGRNTACVFHLMRSVEIGLRALSRELGAQTEGIDSWDDVLRKLRDALKLRDFELRPDPPKRYFDNLIGFLYAIKTAWRNATMHIEAKYDEQEASDIYSAVRVFMRSAAEHLNDRN